MNKKKLDARAIAIIGLLMALEIILTRVFSFEVPFFRIGIGFLPGVMIAMMYGPWIAGITALATDIIGMTLLPKAMFFPGFTLSAVLGAVIYGLVLYKKPKSLGRIIVAVLLVSVIVNLGLNSLWLSMMYDKAFIAIFPGRVVSNLIGTPLRVALIYLVVKSRVLERYLQPVL
ncbi:folate family ECF transporter S component [Carnobacterium gallinarum]|uniref:folate family ECF transporter S component n=1 Tax=Carnobacterium gallinarum TaxID=2749 RepID=UPI000553FDB9|nr:folate family ECF transporter S component [Carnobacterium gallinarum]